MSIDKLFDEWRKTNGLIKSAETYSWRNFSRGELVGNCYDALKAGYEAGQESKQLEIDALLHKYCDYDLIRKENKQLKEVVTRDTSYTLSEYLEKIFEIMELEVPKLFEPQNKYRPKLDKLVKKIKKLKEELKNEYR